MSGRRIRWSRAGGRWRGIMRRLRSGGEALGKRGVGWGGFLWVKTSFAISISLLSFFLSFFPISGQIVHFFCRVDRGLVLARTNALLGLLVGFFRFWSRRIHSGCASDLFDSE